MGYCVLELPEDASRHIRREPNDFRVTEKEVMTMPAGDGTGPLGFGPMTGRAAGYCAGYPVPGYMNPVRGRGLWNWPGAGGYGAAPYAGLRPYGYGAGYAPRWGGPFGWFGRGRGRGFGRGWGRGFGRGRGRGWFGW